MQKAIPQPEPRKAALAFIFSIVLLDVIALGIIIPVMPKLVESMLGGDLHIQTGPVESYASVDAVVKIGELHAGRFSTGKQDGLLGQSLVWTGKGKYTLRARLVAGDLHLD